MRRAILAAPGAGLNVRLFSEIWDDLSAGKKVVVLECGGAFEDFAQFLNSGYESDGRRRAVCVKLSDLSHVSIDHVHDLKVFDFYDVRHRPAFIEELCCKLVNEIKRSSVSKIIILDEHYFPAFDMLAALWALPIDIDVCFLSVEALKATKLDSYIFDELSQHLVAKTKHIDALVASNWVPAGKEDIVWKAHKQAVFVRGFAQTINFYGDFVEKRTYKEIPSVSAV